MTKLAGKVALVTGAGRGLGRACAQIFAREGAKVIVATRTAEHGEETVRLIEEAGGEARFVQADVSCSADIRAMVQAAVDIYGGLDCAINNAMSSLGPQPLAAIAEEDWDRAMATNLRGVFLCMKAEIEAMLDRGGGAIVNIGSGKEHSAMKGMSWYLAAKQGIYALTKCAALDYVADGIRINAVAPGTMWTPLLRDAAQKDPAHLAARVSRTPLGRLAEPEEVARIAVYLCTSEASYVLGQVISVDGGFSLN